MQLSDINIRDPFVLKEGGIYYLYGTRAKNFGIHTGGFDVYKSTDLQNWSNPIACFDAQRFGLNREVSWAPEVHKYDNRFYMFATFTQPNHLRGVYVLAAKNPEGPFYPHTDTAITPNGWECLDGTLYKDTDGNPYLVFCHEHTQITDGTICYAPLRRDLKVLLAEPTVLFAGSSPAWADANEIGKHYITDGPFLYRTAEHELLLLWSTFIKGNYALCVAKSDNGNIDGTFSHLPPLITDDGGHGMIFQAGNRLLLTFQTPNNTGLERPVLWELEDLGTTVRLKARHKSEEL